MMRFKKLFYFNILVCVILTVFTFPGICYSHLDALRVQIGNYERLDNTLSKQKITRELGYQNIDDIEMVEAYEGSPGFESARSAYFDAEAPITEVAAELKKELIQENWWLQPYWREKGMPNEQISIVVGGHPIDIYNWNIENLTKEQLSKIISVLVRFSKIRDGDITLKKTRYILIDNIQKIDSISGNERNGEKIGDALCLFPIAFRGIPHRIAGVTNLEGTLIHELSHELTSLIEADWFRQFKWQYLDMPITLSDGYRTNHRVINPERCVSIYATHNPEDDICDSMVAAIGNPSILDLERLKYLQDRFLSEPYHLEAVLPLRMRLAKETEEALRTASILSKEKVVLPRLESPIKFKRMGDMGELRAVRRHRLLPPELNIKLADSSRDAFSRLKEEIVFSLDNVSSQRTMDVRKVVECAQRINPNIPIPFSGEELAAMNGKMFTDFLLILNQNVFLPANQFLAIEKKGKNELILYHAYVKGGTWEEEQYLGKSVWTADIEWDNLPPSDISFALFQYGFVCRDTTRLGFNRSHTYFGIINLPDKFSEEKLSSWLKNTNQGVDALERLSIELTRLHERCHAKQNVFAGLLSGKKNTPNPNVIETQAVILKPDSELKYLIDNTTASDEKERHLELAVELNADLGGLIAGMEFYLRKNDSNKAYAFFLDYLVSEWHENNVYQDVEKRIIDRMIRLGAVEFGEQFNSIEDLLVFLENKSETQHPSYVILEILKKAYSIDFWTDEERANLVAANRAANNSLTTESISDFDIKSPRNCL